MRAMDESPPWRAVSYDGSSPPERVDPSSSREFVGCGTFLLFASDDFRYQHDTHDERRSIWIGWSAVGLTTPS
jgi:hypothetical protein